jgi:hypothetical protein
MSKVLFQPVRITEDKLKNKAYQNGTVYFTSDSGKIYMDTTTERIAMGAAGIAIYYGNAKLDVKEEITEYNLPKANVNGNAKVNDLIFNSDGGFYKVTDVGENYYTCTLLAVSGGGGTGSNKAIMPSIIECSVPAEYKTLINGQAAYFHLEAESAKDSNDRYLDSTLYVSYKLYVSSDYENGGLPYYEEANIPYEEGKGTIKDDIEFGSKLRGDTTSTLVVEVSGDAHDAPASRRINNIITTQLTLAQTSDYSPTNRYNVGDVKLYYQANGDVNKLVRIYFDDMETPVSELYLPKSDSGNINYSGNYSVDAKLATHGTHTVRIELHQVLQYDANTETYKLGNQTKPLKYEIPVVANDPKMPPVIWLGEYQDTYYTYDTITVPFLAYDPASTVSAVVHLCKNDIEIEGGERTITKFDEFSEWEIADAELGAENNYSIWCGATDDRKVERKFSIAVVTDPLRTMEIAGKADLVLDFNANGRNNSESAARRKTWKYKLDGEEKFATFDNFNWHNNGWDSDASIKTSYLKISNGAKFAIPFKPLVFGSTVSGKISHTIEMQLKIRNVQRYGNLISNLTRYEIPGGFNDKDEPIDFIPDSDVYKAFTEQDKYDNYDAYLQATLEPVIYDNLKFARVEKLIDMKNVVGGFYSKNSEKSIVGVCVGTEDAFFSNGTNTVNVNFVENQLLNLSFVYQHGLRSLYIYINGVITGVIKSSMGEFKIDSSEFVFDSTYCDIDLYKLRVFQNNLNVSQIVNNFAVDRKNVDIYDQNGLAKENNVLQEFQLDFNLVEAYNAKNPSKPTMPYIIYHTGDLDSKLSYSKDNVKEIKVEFVNAPLEYAYSSGRLATLVEEADLVTDGDVEKAVRDYYKHHCPSWISSIRDTDRVTFEVQGTSSQFYPRRNYKIKTKTEGKYCWKDNADLDPKDQDLEAGGAWTEEECLNIFMHKGPFAKIYNDEKKKINASEEGRKELYGYEESRMHDGWYMNNYTNGTDRWTMKVDFMESSGSYNAGFASLMGNAYTKHPLQDHWKYLTNKNKLKPVFSSQKLVDDDGMIWDDYRTSLLGFPVMAFQKRGEGDNAVYTFLGYYRMLLDKSSTAVLGYKPHKDVCHTMFPDGMKDGVPKYKRLRDVAECWEFSNNARGFCSYRDPWSRVQLSFLAPDYLERDK